MCNISEEEKSVFFGRCFFAGDNGTPQITIDEGDFSGRRKMVLSEGSYPTSR